MANENILLNEAKSRLNEILTRLRGQLNELESQGVITKLDGQKLALDATQSANAIKNALEQPNYPIHMQKELINRLIIQFESSADNILTQARSKLYSPERIQERLLGIEQKVISRYSASVNKWVSTNPKIIAQIRKEFTRKIRSLIENQQHDFSLVEMQLQNYEQVIVHLLEEQLPKLVNLQDFDSKQAQEDGSKLQESELEQEKKCLLKMK